jgi:hypothetical protein
MHYAPHTQQLKNISNNLLLRQYLCRTEWWMWDAMKFLLLNANNSFAKLPTNNVHLYILLYRKYRTPCQHNHYSFLLVLLIIQSFNRTTAKISHKSFWKKMWWHGFIISISMRLTFSGISFATPFLTHFTHGIKLTDEGASSLSIFKQVYLQLQMRIC